jgi:Tfp pilus assembly protein PilO
MTALLRRVLVERRALVIPLAALALVNLAAYLFVVYPLALRAATLGEQVTEARRQRLMAERLYAEARATASGRERADVELREFYAAVLPADVAGARRITYGRLAALAREAGLRYDHRSYATDSSYKGAVEKLHITMVLQGGYRDIRRFIHALETSPEFVVIERVALTDQAHQEGLTLTLELATYYRPEAHGN